MFPGTFVISMVGIRELAAALGVDVDWLVENLPHNFIIASDAEASDNFGFSVDVSSDGTRAIIGAYATDTGGGDAGAAYIYKKDGDTWSEEAILYASDRAASDNFGYSVSINSDGSKVLIGARTEDTSPASNQGAAYVFSRTGTSWSQDQKLLASDKETGDQFGINVDISEDGNYAIVGAYLEDENGNNNGAAYIFKYSGSTWTEEQKLIAGEFFNGGSGADPGGDGSQFGYSVSIDTSGRIVIIGARLYDVPAKSAAGAAFVFKNSPSVITVENQAIGPSVNEDNQDFGSSIDISGDKSYLAVGANLEDFSATITNSGAVYILRDSNGTWIHDQLVRASDRVTGDQFGTSVAMSKNNRIIVGAQLQDENGSSNGAAYVFRDSSGTWVEEQKLIAGEFFNGGSGADVTGGDQFGYSVDISDNDQYAIIGARLYDVGAAAAAGAAFVFKYDPTTITVENQAIGPSVNEDNQDFGYSIDMASNGSKAIVGANQEDFSATITNTGAVYFLRDSGGTWVHDQLVRASDRDNGDQFGTSVAMSKQGNYAIVGAQLQDENGSNNGAAYIFKDSNGTWVEEQKLIAGEFFNGGSGTDVTGGDQFGYSVDISQDGSYAIIGARLYDVPAKSAAGAAFVFKKDPTTITVENQAIGPSVNEDNQDFGYSIDISGDGSKALVGANQEDFSATITNTGAVYFLRDSNGTWVHDQLVRASDRDNGDQFGTSVAISKDGNYAIIGAQLQDGNGSNNGAAYVFKDSNGTWVEKQKLTASNPTGGDQFGYSVDISQDGSYAIIGARLYDVGAAAAAGAAYIFKDSNGTWVEKQTLTASNAGASDYFGTSVSISNDGFKAIVGAQFEDGNATDAGAAYVFSRSGESWTEDAKLKASDAAATDYFGISVDIDSSGEYAIIGAYYEDAKGTNAGAAYVFKDSNGTWIEKQKLTASDGLASDLFGYDVSISDSSATVVVGAYDKDYMTYLPSNTSTKYTTLSNTGAAYVFKQTNDVWSEFSKIQASDAEASDNFGFSVTISGDANKVLVGAYQEDTNGSNNGKAYSFNVNNQTTEPYPIIWRQQQKLTASNAGASDYFGNSVAIDSDGFTALIGAQFEDGSATDAGAAYVFKRTGSSWTEDAKLKASDAAANDYFGISVDLSNDGTRAIIGAYYEDAKGTNAGAAYIFKDDEGWSQDQKITASDGLASDLFGYSVKMSGDGNFVTIGAYDKDYMTYLPSNTTAKYTTLSNTGAAYIFKDSGGSFGEFKKIQASDAEASDNFGFSVSINNTGSKVLVGAYQEDTNGSNNGKAYSFNVGIDSEQTEPYPIIWRQQQKLTASNAGASDYFGTSVSISNDGSKALIGAQFEDGSATDAGAAYVFSRSNATWTEDAKLKASNAGASDYFGTSVDITQDGNYGIIGAYYEDAKGTNAGAAYVFKDSNGTWVEKQKLTASDGLASDLFGYDVSADSDGTYFIVGAYDKDYMTYLPSNTSTKYTTLSNTGAAYIFKDSAGTWGEFRKIQASDAEASDRFGFSVTISNDGLKAAAGAYQEDTNGSNNGKAYSFNVDNFTTEDYPIIWRQQQKLTASNAGASDYFGTSVATDGSGSKILIGAQYEDDGGTDAGAAYVFKDSNGTWLEKQKLTASNRGATDYFGISVDLSTNGEFAIIGASFEDAGGTNAGAAYVFKDSNDTFIEKRKLEYFQANATFGQAVALDSDGSVAVIGANTHDYGSASNTGSAVIYDLGQPYARDPRTISVRQNITATVPSSNAEFGSAINVSNDKSRIVVGAFNEDTNFTNSGAAYVFRDSNGTFIQEQLLKPNDLIASDFFGNSVAIDSDADTLIIGSYGNGPLSDSGAVYIFNRTDTTWTQSQKILGPSSDPGGFGYSVSISDNGEYAIVGAYNEDGTGTNRGAAYILKDSNGTWVQEQRIIAGSLSDNDQFGYSVDISGDNNYAIVGMVDGSNSNTGGAFIFKDSDGTWVEKAALTASDAAANDYFGSSLAISKNGDYAVIGAYQEDASGTNTGSVYIFNRTNETWSQQAKIAYPSIDTSARFGYSVDISADGDYIIVGAQLSDTKSSNEGAAYVYSRSGSTWTLLHDLDPVLATGAYFGSSVTISPDATLVASGAPKSSTSRGDAAIFTTWKGS